MELVAVLDVMGGRVVHARRGERGQYAPIVSPLCAGADPVLFTNAVLDASGGRTLYVADLDALQAGPPQIDVLRAVLNVLAARDAELWLDAGFADRDAAHVLLQALGAQRERVTPVFATEALRDLASAAQALADPKRAILSLDRRGGHALDRAGLWERPDLWPDQLIIMTLDAVGASSGPALDVLTDVRRRAEARARPLRLIGAGGLRDRLDAAAAAAAGAHAWLVATALHAGRLGRGASAGVGVGASEGEAIGGIAAPPIQPAAPGA